MLTELVEYGHKLDEEMKAMLSEIKENVQGTNSDGKETGTQINSLDQEEEINISPEQNEETRIQKNALADVAQWIEHWPVNQKVTGLIPSQGTCLGHRPDPGWGAVRGSQMIFLSHINVSLPLFLPPFPSF